MIELRKKKYTATLNPLSGVVETLRMEGDSESVNLVHRDWVSGFGNPVFTRKNANWDFGDFLSPVQAKSWHIPEERTFCVLRERTDSTLSFFNASYQLALEYTFEENFFTVRMHGECPDFDQAGLDLNPAMLDLRQDDPVTNQFTVKSFSIGRSAEIQYVYFTRPGDGRGLLFHSVTPGAKWRIRYLEYRDHSLIEGFQFLARIGRKLDPEAADGPLDFTVCVSCHENLEEAMKFMHERCQCPEIRADVLSVREGGTVRFHTIHAPCAGYELAGPDGTLRKFGPEVSSLVLPSEGFYHLRAFGENGLCHESVFHAGKSWHEAFVRSAEKFTPAFSYCAEGWYWAQAFLCENFRTEFALNFVLQGPGQGRTWPGYDLQPVSAPDMPASEGRFLYFPVPDAHTFMGQTFSPCHLFRWQRIQDAFAFVQIFLAAFENTGDERMLEYAVTLCETHCKDHQTATGGFFCRYEDGSEHDYTTVIAPVQAVCELYETLHERKDPRAEYFADAAIRAAEYLLKRGFEFPTEGVSAHLRWTEDGSISCTALSLLEVYSKVRADARYLERAKAILDYHDAWRIETSDVRTGASSFRYWETQWEGDAEGRDINCGHAWTLWQGESEFLLGIAESDFRRLHRSWNSFRTNFVKFQPGGTAYATFIPDLIPQRPREARLYGCYPENPCDRLAFYLWPRAFRTWERVTAVGEEDGRTAVLNGTLLRREGNKIVIRPDAEDAKIVSTLGPEVEIVTEF